MQKYLELNKYIDWQTNGILYQARQIASGLKGKEEIAKACFLFVRDEIKHSMDYKLNPVTCKASDVLKYGTQAIAMRKVIYWLHYSELMVFQRLFAISA